MMETLKVQLTKEKARRIRKAAMEEFGHKKGAISKAAEQAFDGWMNKRRKGKNELPDWSKLRGVLKDIKMSSVELQHLGFEPLPKNKYRG